jgi:hypothetical protein
MDLFANTLNTWVYVTPNKFTFLRLFLFLPTHKLAKSVTTYTI